MYPRSFRKLCGKCASAHTCVMWCFSQVLEASFHCVTFWHHPGLPAPPSAATRCSVADNQEDPELLQVYLSFVAMKTNGNEDAFCNLLTALISCNTCIHVHIHCMRLQYLCFKIYLFLYVQVKTLIQTSIQFLAEHAHPHIMFC